MPGDRLSLLERGRHGLRAIAKARSDARAPELPSAVRAPSRSRARSCSCACGAAAAPVALLGRGRERLRGDMRAPEPPTVARPCSCNCACCRSRPCSCSCACGAAAAPVALPSSGRQGLHGNRATPEPPTVARAHSGSRARSRSRARRAAAAPVTLPSVAPSETDSECMEDDVLDAWMRRWVVSLRDTEQDFIHDSNERLLGAFALAQSLAALDRSVYDADQERADDSFAANFETRLPHTATHAQKARARAQGAYLRKRMRFVRDGFVRRAATVAIQARMAFKCALEPVANACLPSACLPV